MSFYGREKLILVFVDYLDSACSESPEYKRFSCSVGLHGSDAEPGSVLDTDDWQEVLLWAKSQVQIEREAIIEAFVLQIKREVLAVASCGLAFYKGGPANNLWRLCLWRSSQFDLLKEIYHTIPEAFARLGDEWRSALVYCWQHAGDPAKYD